MVVKFDYADMLETADELINEFGQDATISVPGARSGDAFNPTIGAPTTATVVIVEVAYKAREIDGEKVLAQDKKLIIRADAAAPLLSATQITYGGTTYKFIGPVSPLNPGGTLLMYTAQVRA
jgi:hypothetical protein